MKKNKKLFYTLIVILVLIVVLVITLVTGLVIRHNKEFAEHAFDGETAHYQDMLIKNGTEQVTETNNISENYNVDSNLS